MTGCKNVLFCTDFSDDANKAFDYALDLAVKNDARLHILHVPHSPYTYCRHIVDEHVPENRPGGEAFFDEDVEKRATTALEKEYNRKMGSFRNYLYVIRVGSPHMEIARYARKHHVDMIVLGAVGKYEKDREIHGSTVDNVHKYTHCPVMAVGEHGRGDPNRENFPVL